MGFFKNKFFDALLNKKDKKLVPVIIENSEHKIKKSSIEFNALKVVYRLRKFGFEAYIVGGAIRDYLLGKTPKDFDVATNASPKEVRKIFTNARIIGKRFKLVHIIFKDCIIETATFRADNNENASGIIVQDNDFGTMEEDAMRRDFSINSLYYDSEKELIIDFVNGYEDIKERKIRVLKKPEISFVEDPVRMLRAVKYSVLCDCSIDKNTFGKIVKCSPELAKCPASRLLEEISKIIKSSKSSKIIKALWEAKLARYLIPFLTDEVLEKNGEQLFQRLEKFDAKLNSLKENIFEVFWNIVFSSIFEFNKTYLSDEDAAESVKNEFYSKLGNIRVPNKIIENSARLYYYYQKLSINTDKIFYNKIKKFQLFYLLPMYSSIMGNEKLIDFFKNAHISVKKGGKKKYSVNSGAKKFVVTKLYNSSI